MSLTPPPPPPPHRPSSGTVPSGCKTPKLNILPGASRRLSSNLSPSGQSTTAPSPNQLREILADITKQVNNSPQSSSSTRLPSARPSPIRSINGFMRPSLRETGPVTRSRSMLHLINTRSSLTPRATRANTPVRDENHSPLLPPTTPRTPFTNHFNNNSSSSSSPPHHRSPISNENQASSSRTPAHPIAPLRYRTLSSVASSIASSSNPLSSSSNSSTPSSPSTTSEESTRPPPTPSSHPSLRLRPHSSNPASSVTSSTPPLTPASSLTSTTTPSHSLGTTTGVITHGINTPRERRSADQLDSPDTVGFLPSPTGSIAKRRRRNPSSLGRL
ncbi:hypothetical protein MJO28_002250 [Puccinia striiformis f. sp. tritici]|uniref:Uncharacterized protein n=3 Tax=Puccinia striiformis TaxID=27350 RepID=A0A2S4URB7_9BASI|nr:hypothetical protein Pst134EA_002527 [Puccinia striiformis f. sp. tritici]POV99865.1 hypothetical protein PSTT_13512 [Puccinia striiformis]KAH9471895.1 hypothetical protein Pst134EA_002527 [Puccinia striiformis f. sp. tritici]KAI7961761.1 hypothetical protein MJO28_002250 [Puccinia striiformis f. sp. tritici]KAI7966587.1 hypothetical protein MJO29_002335 [Puccinia striiformis f. sp. tritici]POW12843.1 hypothetical protein PSHT_07984 [Puccinia striiformis]